MNRHRHSTHRHEHGAAMFVAVLVLMMMGALGLAALDTTAQDRNIAGFQNRTQAAFNAAEAGIATARQMVLNVQDRSAVLTLPTTPLGDTALYDRENTLPAFGADPRAASFPNGIVYLGDGPAPGVRANLGSTQLLNSLWQINVQGSSAQNGIGMDGRPSTARIETIEAKMMAGGPAYN